MTDDDGNLVAPPLVAALNDYVNPNATHFHEQLKQVLILRRDTALKTLDSTIDATRVVNEKQQQEAEQQAQG